MEIAVIGSGPVGMAAALLLARQRHRVTLVDRDPGPMAGRPWERVGVMQFHLPHGFRHQTRNLLRDRLPDVYDAVLAAGAVVPTAAGMAPPQAPLHVRRSVFERAFWEAVDADFRLTRLTGHADALEIDAHGCVRGVVVDSRSVRADLVVDASGRAGRLSAAHRPPGQRVDCKMAYAARQYRREARETDPVAGLAVVTMHRGFVSMVFGHDSGTFTVLFVRPSDDKVLAELRRTVVFEAACQVVPGLSEWTDPRRCVPIDDVRAGAGLANEYRRQPAAVIGLVAIGDAWCTTNPQGGRGITLGLQSAAALADLLDQVTLDDLASSLDAWGERELRPWFDDHVEWDASLLRSWAGRRVDPDGPLGIDVLVPAAQELHPEWMAVLGDYFAMEAPPTVLEPIRAQVRELVRNGWQPPDPGGLTRDGLADLIARQLNAATPVSA